MIALLMMLGVKGPIQGTVAPWITDLFASNRAQVVLAQTSTTSPPRSFLSSKVRNAPRPTAEQDLGPIPVARENVDLPFHFDMVEVHKTNREAVDLLEHGKTEKAYQLITSFRDAHPDLSEEIQDTVLDCQLLSGRSSEAYREALTFISHHTGARSVVGEASYLRLSLAAASLGQTFKGQDDYCIQSFTKTLYETWDATKQYSLRPANGSPRKLMALSAIALGTGCGPTQAYLEYALKLEPSNDVVGRMLVQFDGWKGRYTDLRRIAKSMIAHLGTEESRYYQAQIDEVEGLPDRPQPHHSSSVAP